MKFEAKSTKTIDGNDQATARSGVVANRSVEVTEREVPKTKPADSGGIWPMILHILNQFKNL